MSDLQWNNQHFIIYVSTESVFLGYFSPKSHAQCMRCKNTKCSSFCLSAGSVGSCSCWLSVASWYFSPWTPLWDTSPSEWRPPSRRRKRAPWNSRRSLYATTINIACRLWNRTRISTNTWALPPVKPSTKATSTSRRGSGDACLMSISRSSWRMHLILCPRCSRFVSLRKKRFPCQSLVSPAATLIGYCFTVNSAEVIQARGEPLLTKASGTNSALHFVSFINQTEYHVGLDGDVTAGIQVSQALLFERDRQAYLFQERAI